VRARLGLRAFAARTFEVYAELDGALSELGGGVQASS